jgi:hypothetical protein
MTSIVLELQQDAMNKNIEISDLLRKALVVATKLNITDFATWINQELNGYKEDDDIPEYRKIQGIIKARNPYHGLVPVTMPDAETEEKFSNTSTNQPISGIVDLLKQPQSGLLQFQLPNDIKRYLIDQIGLEPYLIIDRSTLARILDTVRTKVLEYALKLEQEGIIGTGISFSTEKKQKASQITYNTINISNMHNSQLQQSSATANQTYNGNLNINDIKSLIKEIKAKTPDLNLSDQDLTKLNSKIKELEKQITSTKPEDNIIKQCLTSMRTICEGVASNVAAVHFINLIARII